MSDTVLVITRLHLLLPVVVAPVVVAPVVAAGGTSEPATPVPIVVVSAPDPLPAAPQELPEGIRIDEFIEPEAPEPVDQLDVSRGAQTLFSDASGERQLVVARSESSDTGGGFAPVGLGETVQLADGREATILDTGSLTIVGWDESESDDCDVCYQTGVVAGRGVSVDELLAAANGASVRQPTPVLADDVVPDGMEVVGVAPLLDPFEDLRLTPLRVLLSDQQGNEALLFVYGGDDALAGHLSFWIDDGIHVGAGYGSDAVVRSAGNAVVLAMSFGIDPEALGAVVDELLAGAPATTSPA